MGNDITEKRFISASGIPIKEVYTSEDLSGFNENKDLGLPGQPPFTRGVYSNMYRGKLWTIRRFSGAGTPEETNKLYKREYELGQTGFSVAYDAPTEAGIDSNDPRAMYDVGTTGVAVNSLLDMEIMFEGLPIDRVSTSHISQNMGNLPLTAMYFAMAEKRGVDLKELKGTTQNDIMVGSGNLWLIDQIAPKHVMRLLVDLIEWCADVAPRWNSVCFDSYNYREQGINAVQELGQLLATATSYVDELSKRHDNVNLDKFVSHFAFNMGAHLDFFEEISKFRAGRRLWYKIAAEKYNCINPRSCQFRFHAQSSGCTHTYQEPYNNLIRIAYEVLASVLGGAQSVHANGYDEGLCLSTDESMKLSIRTEQILQYETNIVNTVDPLGGSYYVEALTNNIEKQASDYIDKIINMGGIVHALESGWIHNEYIEAMNEHIKKVEKGDIVIVGVNKFIEEEKDHIYPVYRPNPKAVNDQNKKIEDVKSSRDNERVNKTLAWLKLSTISGENVMPAVMEAVKSYATLGEICNVWREVYGLWEYPVSKF